MAFLITPHQRIVLGDALVGVSVFMVPDIQSVAMDRFLSTVDKKCSLQIDPRRT
jgi:hypothetical protein